MDTFELGAVEAMMKVAASVDELQQAYGRIGIERIKRQKDPRMQLVQMGGGAAYVPKPKTVRDPGFLRGLAAHHGLRPEDIKGEIPGQIEAIKKLRSEGKPLVAGGGFSGSGSGMVARLKKDIKKYGMPPDPEMRKQVQLMLDLGAKKSSAGHRAVNVAGGLHEGFERKAAKKPALYGHGHLSPNVIMDETNMLSKMTGKGSDEARKTFSKLRTFDHADITTALRQAYGERGVSYVREHGFTSAMKKNLMKGFMSGRFKWGRIPGSAPAPAVNPKLQLRSLISKVLR